MNEKVTLLAYSPLGAGLLTGKYQDGAVPEGSRMAGNGDWAGARPTAVFEAVAAYHRLAASTGSIRGTWRWPSPFSGPSPSPRSSGATTSDQLAHTLAGLDVTLSDAVLEEIDTLHKAHPMPY